MKQIFDMWLACFTQEEIGEVVGLSEDAIEDEVKLIRNLETLPNFGKLSATFQDEEFKVARTLTPERQLKKDEAYYYRRMFGWTERQIAGQLNVPKSTIDVWLPKKTNSSLPNNSELLAGDCLEVLLAASLDTPLARGAGTSPGAGDFILSDKIADTLYELQVTSLGISSAYR